MTTLVAMKITGARLGSLTTISHQKNQWFFGKYDYITCGARNIRGEPGISCHNRKQENVKDDLDCIKGLRSKVEITKDNPLWLSINDNTVD